ncbi:RNA-binding protein Ro60-like [Hydractinia symbiolongicarpus]|uniref:RNA-binding protein Ro60-like n=1 Tax=Hydractinia symbiolongicarpus TaxID=13093 RepID=UPI00254B8465|nr:RNA-binding protein Ro60-like [Hydractinia symbiolongicarpus]XP_057300079.1 RNA-binding protein Ro60-like [Hydractinia symbiolongicarpus]
MAQSCAAEDATMSTEVTSTEFSVDAMQQFKRFLMLGCENTKNITTCIDIVKSNISNLMKLIQDGGYGCDVIKVLKEYRKEGKCEKLHCLLMCLAICAVNESTKTATRKILTDICYIPTHLFMFLEFCFQFEQKNRNYEDLVKLLGYNLYNKEKAIKEKPKKKKKTKNKSKKSTKEGHDEPTKKEHDESTREEHDESTKKQVAEGMEVCAETECAGTQQLGTATGSKRNIEAVAESSEAKKSLIEVEVAKEQITQGVKDIDLNKEATNVDMVDSTKMAAKKVGRKDTKPRQGEISKRQIVSKYRKFIEAWYTDKEKSAVSFLYLLTKYQSRYGWDHAMLFRYAHVSIPESDEEKDVKDIIVKYCLKGYEAAIADLDVKKVYIEQPKSRLKDFLDTLKELKQLKVVTNETEQKIVEIIESKYRGVNGQKVVMYAMPRQNPLYDDENSMACKSRLHLAFEHLPSMFFNSKKVWQALLKDIPLTSLLFNLTRMIKLGIFESEENITCLEKSLSEDKIKKAGLSVHPLRMLTALWNVDSELSMRDPEQNPRSSDICGILRNAFYHSFRCDDCKSKTDQKIIISIEASSAMLQTGFLLHHFLSPAMTAVALSTVLLKSHQSSTVYVGNLKTTLQPEKILKNMRKVAEKNPVKTDPSFAIEETIRRKETVDAFLIFAKSSSSKSYAEFKRYQTEFGENGVKLIICSMTANSSMIADPGNSSIREVCSGDANFVNEICKILEE